MTTTRDRLFSVAVLLAAVAELLLRDAAWLRVGALGVGVALAAVALGFGAVAALDVATLVAGQTPVQVWTGVSVLVLVVALARWGRPRQLVVGAAIIVAVWALHRRQPGLAGKAAWAACS